MSDLIAGPAAGDRAGHGPLNGGAPPPVLLAALAAAALIAIVLFAALGRFGGDDEVPAGSVGAVPAAATAQPERVTLTVTLLGGGDGVVQIQPGDIACTRSCDHRFDKGTRVTLMADPRTESGFAGWDDGCAGSGTCSLVMDADRAVDAEFESRPSEPLCDEALDAGDPACADEDADAGDADPDAGAGADELDAGADELDPTPPSDCSDGRDNDRDGLTDLAQDPDCTSGRGESASSASAGSTASRPPPPAAPTNQCSDGRDNDRDGLTDAAQDPNCTDGDTESG